MLQRFLNWRFIVLLIAIAIVCGTIFYTRYLARKIEREERQRVEEWVQSSQVMQQSQESFSITLANMISVNNEDIPLIATDERDSIIDSRNIDTASIANDSRYLQKKLEELKTQNSPIPWPISDTPKIVYYVYYGNSSLLTEVQYYPLVQLLIVSLFIILIVSLITIQSKSTQNQVWAGMAKETAHQMGTPLTSLQGWMEMLREIPGNEPIIDDIEKDVFRLKLVSERFGKIGSKPQLQPTMLKPLVEDMVVYIKRRASGKVQFEIKDDNEDLEVMISPTLFNWVLENLLKNALDAMEGGSGKIIVAVTEQVSSVFIDVSDSGKGISPANIKKVFKPGFTTKKRGWGLGLSLSKRIMEQYHKGELYVKNSDPGKGTTFRIVLHR